MPLASSISAGNIIHRPYIGRISYIGSSYITASGAPTSAATSLSYSINIPTNIGPNKVMWIGLVTTRSGAAQNISSVTLNNRDMELLVATDNSAVHPIRWYGIKLRDDETNPAIFTVTEANQTLRSMLVTIYIGRGTISSYGGLLAYDSDAVITSGSNGTNFINQTSTLSLNYPIGPRSVVLFTATKGFQTTGDNTNSGSPQGWSPSTAVSTIYTMPDNLFRIYHGTATVNPGIAGPSSPAFAWFTNTITISQAAAIVVY